MRDARKAGNRLGDDGYRTEKQCGAGKRESVGCNAEKHSFEDTGQGGGPVGTLRHVNTEFLSSPRH
jgi:hypothetical protein